MAERQLAWGIVGLGRIANTAIAPAIRAAANGHLVACCSRDLAKAQAFAQRHGADRAYDSYEAFLADPAVEAVFLATPNALHAEQTIGAARVGKHVLCEKPLATTVRDADAMIAACARAGVTLGIGLHMRFEPFYARLRQLLRDGTIGRCVAIMLQRSTPPGLVNTEPTDWRRVRALAGLGTLYDTGPHVFDLLRWLTGAEPRRIAVTVRPPWDSGKPEDTSLCLVECDDGCLVTVRLIRDILQPANDFFFYGNTGSIVTGPTRGVDTFRITVRTAEGDEEMAVPAANPYLGEIEQFARQIAGEQGLAATTADARRLVVISEAIVASLDRSAIVDIPA